MNFLAWMALALVAAWIGATGAFIWFLVHAQWQSAIAAFLIALLLDSFCGQLARALKD